MSNLNRLLFAVILFSLTACGSQNEFSEMDILDKAATINGSPVAYVGRSFTGGGATGSTVYSVYLRGQIESNSSQFGELVFEGLHACDIRLEWESSDRLLIHYNGVECDIRKFKNDWYDPNEVKSERYRRVEIVLMRNS